MVVVFQSLRQYALIAENKKDIGRMDRGCYDGTRKTGSERTEGNNISGL